jgi:hypothetical protein
MTTSAPVARVTPRGRHGRSTSTQQLDQLIRHIVIAKMLRREIDQTAHPGARPRGSDGSFAPFSDLSAFVRKALMYLGWLEIVAVLVLFTTSHWRA